MSLQAFQQKDIYQKRHSFDTFRSNMGSDIDRQKQRVLNILKNWQGRSSSRYQKEIVSSAAAGLEKGDEQNGDFKITVYIADELSRMDDSLVPRYIFHRYRYDVFPKFKKVDAYPPYLQIEPSSICNFRCVFCYQTDTGFTNKKQGHMGVMNMDMFKRIIDEIEGNVDFISLASRGEPLVSKDIDQMIEYCAGKFLGLKMNTNASLLNEKHCHAILSGGINTLVFSADAAEEPLYSQLRVGGKLTKVLKNVELFQDIKNKHYPRSKIITRVSGVKVQDDQDINAMVSRWGGLVDQVAFVKYNPWENVYDNPLNDIAEPCTDLWRRMFVWFDGRINPCDTDYKSHLSVGSLENQTITRAWQSAPYKKLRDMHLEKQRGKVHPCQRCTVV